MVEKTEKTDEEVCEEWRQQWISQFPAHRRKAAEDGARILTSLPVRMFFSAFASSHVEALWLDTNEPFTMESIQRRKDERQRSHPKDAVAEVAEPVDSFEPAI